MIKEVSPLQLMYEEFDKSKTTITKPQPQTYSRVQQELDAFRNNQPVFTSTTSRIAESTQNPPREKTLAEMELEKFLVKEREESHFAPASLHVKILGKEAMDHAEKPALLSA